METPTMTTWMNHRLPWSSRSESRKRYRAGAHEDRHETHAQAKAAEDYEAQPAEEPDSAAAMSVERLEAPELVQPAWPTNWQAPVTQGQYYNPRPGQWADRWSELDIHGYRSWADIDKQLIHLSSTGQMAALLRLPYHFTTYESRARWINMPMDGSCFYHAIVQTADGPG
eukprot:2370861-Amphidinium_carterae.1